MTARFPDRSQLNPDLVQSIRSAFDDLNRDVVATLARLTPARRIGMVSDLAAAGRQALRVQVQQSPVDPSGETIDLQVSERMLAHGGISPALIQRIRHHRR
jgi:hypothetical protein